MSPATSLAILPSRLLATPALFSARRTARVAMSRLATYSAPSYGVGSSHASSLDIAPVSADCTDTESEPCAVSAKFGRYTASSWPSFVTIPPVAVVSGVISTSTGSVCSTASERSAGPVAVKVSFAVPSTSTFAGQLTITDSLG